LSVARKKRTSVEAAGTIVVDAKKPARIILRNNIIIVFALSSPSPFSFLLMKCREKNRDRKKKENFDNSRQKYNRL
jgi:hypothetical protein